MQAGLEGIRAHWARHLPEGVDVLGAVDDGGAIDLEAEQATCPACGEVFKPGVQRCPGCGLRVG